MSDILLAQEMDKNAALEERIAELEGLLRTEAEKTDLLSKEHYRERIAELEQRCKALSRQSQAFASLATQRGARMQIMMNELRGADWGYSNLWALFCGQYPDAADWFDESGVPVQEGAD